MSKPLTPWVMVGPMGLEYIGLHPDAEDTWRVALGWPDAEEINDRIKQGWYVAEATATWQRPKEKT
jgi:hypothetical protein